MGVTRKQSTPIFPKIEHFLPPDTHTNALFPYYRRTVLNEVALPLYLNRNWHGCSPVCSQS